MTVSQGTEVGRSPGAGERQPYFFLSYAPTPRLAGEDPQGPDMLATEFFRDLCARVQRAAGLPPHTEVGHYGPDLPPGERWQARVGQALGACRVFVPLYSPRYFDSPTCGRELSAFLRRTERGRPPEPPITPVVWVPTPVSWPDVPPPLAAFGDADVEGRYSSDGLYGLMALRDTGGRRRPDGDYERVVGALSARIAHLAATSPLPQGLPVDLGTVPNPFARTVRRSRLGLRVLAPTTGRLPAGRDDAQYGPTPLAWNPYRDETPNGLIKHMVDIAKNLGYEPDVTAFDGAPDDLMGELPVGGPEVLLVDPWALDDPQWRDRLRDFDGADMPWVGVVAAWDIDDPQTWRAQERLLDQLHATLHRRFARRRPGLRLDAGVASTLDDFGRAVSTVIQEAATQFLRRAPASPHRTETTRGPQARGAAGPHTPEAPDGG
jgi:FxsC-like protein